MLAVSLLLLRYVLGTVSIGLGLVLLPMPIPLGVPLIIAGIALYAGSTKPIRYAWIKFRRLLRNRPEPNKGRMPENR